MATAAVPGISALQLLDFSGGLNLVAAPSEFELNESPKLLNVQLDERGGVVKRLGLQNLGPVGSETEQPLNLYYSLAINRVLIQIGAKVFSSSDGGGSWGAAIKTFSTSARVGMCDFLGKVVLIHPVDGAWTYDGATFSATRVANSPNGNCIVVWQNYLWSCGDPANPSRISRSDAGAITWPSSGMIFNDIRIKDDTPLTCLLPGPTQMLAFKEESTYRINDPANVAYIAIGMMYGASGPLCASLSGNQASAICKRGITLINGVETPEIVSAKIDPFFHSTQVNFTQAPNWCCQGWEDGFIYSVAEAGSSINSTTLEFNSRTGSFVRHDFGMQDYANYLSATRILLGAKVSTTNTFSSCFRVFTGGTDDGQPVYAMFQSLWLEPSRSYLTRLRRARVKGRGEWQFTVLADYTDVGFTYDFKILTDGMLWGTGIWGADIWGANPYEGYNDFYSLGVSHAVSFMFSQTSDGSAISPPLRPAPLGEVGDFACYGLSLDFVNLAFA
jgi:hypothetical protein